MLAEYSSSINPEHERVRACARTPTSKPEHRASIERACARTHPYKILESERTFYRDKYQSEHYENYTTSDECFIPLTFVDGNAKNSQLNCQFDRVDDSRVEIQDASAIILEKSMHTVTYATRSEGMY